MHEECPYVRDKIKRMDKAPLDYPDNFDYEGPERRLTPYCNREFQPMRQEIGGDTRISIKDLLQAGAIIMTLGAAGFTGFFNLRDEIKNNNFEVQKSLDNLRASVESIKTQTLSSEVKLNKLESRVDELERDFTVLYQKVSNEKTRK
jgi:hypothetical protein